MHAHRLVALPGPGELVDHINRDPLDNRLCNLRSATKSTNGMNRGLNQNNTSGYKGVSWKKRRSKWTARVRVGRREVSCGYFIDPVDAAIAYDIAALRLHGEFAWTNFLS